MWRRILGKPSIPSFLKIKIKMFSEGEGERERERDSIYDCKSNRVPGARVGEDEEF